MPIRTECTSCQKKLQVRDDLVGKKVKCPGCGTAFVVAASPAAADKVAAKPMAKKAPPPRDDDDVEKKVAAKPAPKKAPPPPPMDDDEDMDDVPVKAKGKKAPPPEDDDDEDSDDAPARSRGKAKKSGGSAKLWIGIAAAVLLLGGSVTAYFMFFSGPAKAPVAQKKLNAVKPVIEATTPVAPVQPAAVNASLADMVPGDALIFFSLSGDMWNAAGLESIRKMVGPAAEEGFLKNLGFPLADLERVSLFTLADFAQFKNSDMPPAGILVQTRKPVPQQVVTAALQNGELGKNAKLTAEFLSDQAFVLGPAPMLPVYKAKKGKTKATGALERALGTAATSSGVVVSVVVPLEAAKEAEVAMKDIPPFFTPFLKTKELFATVELADRLNLNVSLFAADAGGAQECKKAVDGLVAFAGIMLDQASKDPQNAMLAKFGQQMLKDLKITVQDKEMALALQTDVGTLMAVGMSTIEKVRGAAGGAQDMNNLKQIALAWHTYHDAMKTFPPQTVGKGLSWRVAILPYIEQGSLYQQFKLDEPWDSAHNIKLLPLMPKLYETAGKAAGPGKTFLQTFVGPNTINKVPTQGMKLLEILDGTSNTLIVAEAARAVDWTKPEDIAVAPNQPVVLGGVDPANTLAVLADGSVRRLARTLDQQVLRWLIDPADGNVIPDLDSPKPGKK